MLLLKSLFHLLEFIFFYIINRESIIPKIALIWQENQRYKRYFDNKKIKIPFSLHEKWFISNPKARKLLIKKLKIENYLWGCKRIQDELEKISIDISRETIRKVIQDYRKSGEIKPNYSWSKFLKSHWQSLFACDFFTVDIFGFKRLYVFFIIELKTRKIVHYNITQNPNIRFLRNQFNYFEELYPDSHLIHDNS